MSKSFIIFATVFCSINLFADSFICKKEKDLKTQFIYLNGIMNDFNSKNGEESQDLFDVKESVRD